LRFWSQFFVQCISSTKRTLCYLPNTLLSCSVSYHYLNYQIRKLIKKSQVFFNRKCSVLGVYTILLRGPYSAFGFALANQPISGIFKQNRKSCVSPQIMISEIIFQWCLLAVFWRIRVTQCDSHLYLSLDFGNSPILNDSFCYHIYRGETNFADIFFKVRDIGNFLKSRPFRRSGDKNIFFR
jgi:hypothetical protein